MPDSRWMRSMVVRVSSNAFSPLYRDALSGGRRCSYPLTYLSTRGDGLGRGLTVSVFSLVREPSNDRLLCLVKGRKGPTDRPSIRQSVRPSACPSVPHPLPHLRRGISWSTLDFQAAESCRVPYVRPFSPFPAASSTADLKAASIIDFQPLSIKEIILLKILNYNNIFKCLFYKNVDVLNYNFIKFKLYL